MQQFKLQNGLTVLVQESHTHPIVTLDMWVNTGSRNENNRNNGISHFLEHMLFKGTPTYGAGEIDQVVEGMGGIWNAGTSKDFTHYYLTVGSVFFEKGLDVLSDIIINSTIDSEEFERERGVILEEYSRKQDSPMAVMYDEIYKQAFKKGPYRATVLGSENSIKQLSHQQMLNYYRVRYRPENMVLVIAGDVELEALKKSVAAAFGDFEPGLMPLPDNTVPTERKKASRKTLRMDVNEAYLAIAWPAPGLDSEDDIYPMDLLATILSDGRSSRLYKKLRDEMQLATAIDCSFSTGKNENLLLIFAVTSPDKVEALEQEIKIEIERMKNELVKAAEINRAKKILKTSHSFSTETTGGITQNLGYYYTITGNTKFETNYLPKIAKVSAKKIQAIAQKYILADFAQTILVLPKAKEKSYRIRKN